MLAYLNSHFQTGLKNVLDRAILQFREIHEKLSVPDFKKVDEIPFDFSRKLMSVVVETPEGIHRLISKGATEAVFQRCSSFELEGKVYPTDPLLITELKEECDALSGDGFRVLAIAYRDMDQRAAYSKDDKHELVLKGYVGFLDPPKETAAPAILALRNHGVAVKTLTGDNELVSRKICQEVGLSTECVLLGGQVETMSDPELAEAAEKTTLFADYLRRISSGSSVLYRTRGMLSDFWEMASTIPRHCVRPMWASRSTPPLTSPRRPPTSSSWRKA